MPSFTLRGVRLSLPDAMLRGNLPEALTSGRYEHTEADALQRHLVAGDRLLDLGAGLGYLCCLAAEVIGAASVTGVEALPSLAQIARENLAQNGHGAATILDGAVVGPGHRGQTAEFVERAVFWASTLATPGEGPPQGAKLRDVPALKLHHLVRKLQPTVILCDVEGAEREVLKCPLAPQVRLVILELHPRLYGAEGLPESLPPWRGRALPISRWARMPRLWRSSASPQGWRRAELLTAKRKGGRRGPLAADGGVGLSLRPLPPPGPRGRRCSRSRSSARWSAWRLPEARHR